MLKLKVAAELLIHVVSVVFFLKGNLLSLMKSSMVTHFTFCNLNSNVMFVCLFS